jgi:4-amino-4-deoxy-L-arabinose transferase-like glycosyltransferase
MGMSATSSRSGTPWLVAAIFLATLLRLAFIVSRQNAPLVGDSASYDSIALNLATGHGYEVGSTDAGRHATAARGPTYVLLVAAVYALAGHRPAGVYLVQVALDALACLLVYKIGRRACGREAIAVLAAFLYAIYPPFIISTGAILTETLVTMLVLAAILGYVTWTQEQKWPALIASALSIGMLGLSKPNLAPLPIVFALCASPAIAWGVRLRALVLQLAIVAIVFAPWVVRNAIAFHTLIPGVSIGGVTFWGGTGPDHGRTLGSPSDPGTPAHVTTAIAGLSEIQADRWFYAEGIRVIRSDPGRYARLLAKKCVRLWLNLWFDDPPSRASIALALANVLAWMAAVFGLRSFTVDRSAARLLFGLVIYFTVIHALFFAVVRYALPVYAYALPFTAAGLIAAGRAGARGVQPRR